MSAVGQTSSKVYWLDKAMCGWIELLTTCLRRIIVHHGGPRAFISAKDKPGEGLSCLTDVIDS